MAGGKRELAYTVWLRDPDGHRVSFGPGDEVPDWAKAQIGDHAYRDVGERREGDTPETSARRPAPRQQRAAKADGEND